MGENDDKQGNTTITKQGIILMPRWELLCRQDRDCFDDQVGNISMSTGIFCAENILRNDVGDQL